VTPLADGSLDPQGPVAEAMAELWWLMLGLGVAVFVAFGVLLVVGLFRRRPAAEQESGRQAPNRFGRWMVGYTWVVGALVAIGFLSFGLWAHHMFAVGLPALVLSFFAAASMAIAIPAGVQFAAWVATIWSGRPVWKTPFLFVVGFLVIFVIGGITGVMVAAVPFDLQAHDSHFVVGHLHYVLIGGVAFPTSPASTTGSRSSPAGCSTSALAGGTSGCCSSASTWPSSRCTSSG